ncbi:DNA mismatch repair protein MutS [Aquifex pyrophilus]|uniref:DNA mismatch repair protein MutS n=1 Tax=Aquifex pyrophilus TaxID=2714 RepID=MUTS_AQUPY|nr:RecName: Full=DNA mismatch repair protein MutS [Aquifex pyrophilus]AAB16998.1 DNA mismatch repair protein [Aquifex pyrophilus]
MGKEEKELTPMLAQYHQFKSMYPDCLLLFRLGDFYELFYEDAVVGSKELGLVLTSRPAGKGRERIPMCGVPYHSANNYIAKLVNKGYKVAICEQVEDPSKAKGIVKRDVIRVITPGTFFERETGGLCSLYRKGKSYLVSYLNLSVGEFIGAKVKEEELIDFLSKFNIREVLVKKGEKLPEKLEKVLKLHITELEEEFFEEGKEELLKDYGVPSIKAFGFQDEDLSLSLGAVYRYAKATQKSFTPLIPKPKPYVDEGYVKLDLKAVKGLEITESIEGRKDLSLFKVVDRTLTGMGRRRLRFRLLNPFRSIERIRKVQEAVEELINKREVLNEIRKTLEGMSDLERLVSRISSNMASPRELIHLKNSLRKAEELRKILSLLDSEIFKEIEGSLLNLNKVADLIDKTLVDDPPLHVKEGGLIKPGVNAYLDELRFIRENAEKLLKEYEKKLKKETGIQSLKIGYNKVMGYYIEVTKANVKYVPEHFRRRQTLSNAERYTTEELQRLEEKILSAQTRINELEYELYRELREEVVKELDKVGNNATLIGEVDYIQSLAWLALEKGWVKPEVHEGYELIIEEGKHPVIEEFTKNYVPNDTKLTEEEFIHVITGPNMAGKSSYIRQVGVLTLLAHTGSFLPVKSARIPLVDAIFTRIGSGDVLALGVSTFMNEMLDVSNILNNATKRSLIILDEVGRGTSTYDGIAISKAIVKYISEKIGAKTLLATHYLELTELERKVKGVKNYHMEVEETDEGIRFLYILKEGRAKGSFGIDVAKLAGLPEEVVREAKKILKELEGEKGKQEVLPFLEETYKKSVDEEKLNFYEEIIKEIEEIDIGNTTPVKALLILAELKERIKSFIKR